MRKVDDPLLKRVNLGDELAFKEIFKRHRDRVFNYVFKITKSKETSEEIVLDVFLKLWDGRALINEIEDFSAFIFTLAKNKSIDFLRKAAKDKVLQELIWDEIQIKSGSSADELVLVNELQKELGQAIHQLSPQRQAVYRLSREEHLTYDQIAQHLHLSKSTIKNHMIDSLRLIRLHLATKMGLLTMCLILKMLNIE